MIDSITFLIFIIAALVAFVTGFNYLFFTKMLTVKNHSGNSYTVDNNGSMLVVNSTNNHQIGDKILVEAPEFGNFGELTPTIPIVSSTVAIIALFAMQNYDSW